VRHEDVLEFRKTLHKGLAGLSWWHEHFLDRTRFGRVSALLFDVPTSETHSFYCDRA